MRNDGSVTVDSFHMLPRFLIAIAISGISYVVFKALSNRLSRKAFSCGTNGMFCEHTLVLDDKGFTETTHVNKNFSSWAGVEEIKETANFLTINLRLGPQYFIPKRAFANPQDARAFFDTAQTHILNANIPPPPSFPV